MRKGKDPEPDPYPYLWLVDPGYPKTCGFCGSGSGSSTHVKSIVWPRGLGGGEGGLRPGSFDLYQFLKCRSFSLLQFKATPLPTLCTLTKININFWLVEQIPTLERIVKIILCLKAGGIVGYRYRYLNNVPCYVVLSIWLSTNFFTEIEKTTICQHCKATIWMCTKKPVLEFLNNLC